MSKKHFKALAEKLRETKPPQHGSVNGPELYQWRADVLAISITCRGFNDRFDPQRFLMACGYTEA